MGEFEKGNLDDIDLTVDDMSSYGGSGRRSTTYESYTQKISFNSDRAKLLARQSGADNKTIMERITDIIANIPSIIILSICSIQFTNNVSLKAALGESGIIVLAFLVAFVYSGWVGVASTTRMQFYRFKGQEYVLASRTLGAKDGRLIFKHILPNAIGTLVTSSVLMWAGKAPRFSLSTPLKI